MQWTSTPSSSALRADGTWSCLLGKRLTKKVVQIRQLRRSVYKIQSPPATEWARNDMHRETEKNALVTPRKGAIATHAANTISTFMPNGRTEKRHTPRSHRSVSFSTAALGPGTQESLIDKQQSKNTELTAKHARSKRSLQSPKTSAPHADAVSYVDTVEMQQESDSTLPGSSLSNSNGTARRPADGTETRRKRLHDNKNEEIHKHHVRDYKKRRRDRNSNMQPVMCSSSDTAMETVTNPQKDTSYSRRQRPHEGEIP